MKYIKYATIALFSILLIYRIIICFSFKHELCNGENNNIWTILNVASNNHKLYTDPEKLPVVIYPYTPISEYPIICISKLFNENSPLYIYKVSVVGRLYQLIMSLLTCVILFKTCKKTLEIDTFQSLFISFIVFALQLPTSMNIRPDATYFFFMVSTIYLLLQYLRDYSNKKLYLVSFIYVTTFFTKQDGLFLIFPILFILIFQLKKWKDTILLSLYTVLNLAMYGVLFYYLYGFNFIKNAFLGIQNTSTLNQLISVFYRFTDFYLINLILGLVVAIVVYFNKDKRLHLISIFCFYYLILALLLSSKLGSWINYYYPFLIFSTILIISYFSKNLHVIYMIFILYASIFNSKIIYHYTSPFIKVNKEYINYKKTYNDYQKINAKLKMKKNDYALIPNILLRTFSYRNSIMINTEYYSFTKFKYRNLIRFQKEKIKHIIFKKEEELATNYLISFFKINLINYRKTDIDKYTIYTHK